MFKCVQIQCVVALKIICEQTSCNFSVTMCTLESLKFEQCNKKIRFWNMFCFAFFDNVYYGHFSRLYCILNCVFPILISRGGFILLYLCIYMRIYICFAFFDHLWWSLLHFKLHLWRLHLSGLYTYTIMLCTYPYTIYCASIIHSPNDIIVIFIVQPVRLYITHLSCMTCSSGILHRYLPKYNIYHGPPPCPADRFWHALDV